MRIHPPENSARGASLVEVMVGLVIGMLVVLTIYEVVATFEGQKRTTTEGAGAQDNGLYAIAAIERDIKMAGWGMLTLPPLDCTNGIDTIRNHQPIAGFSAMPVRIVSNYYNGGQPDTITITSGDSSKGNAIGKVVDVIGGSNAALGITSTIDFKIGDKLLVASGQRCTLGEVTKADPLTPGVIERAPGTFNPTAAERSAWNAAGTAEQIGAAVYNLGNLTQRQYSVTPTGAFGSSLSASDLGGAPAGIADNIVMLKAQYGVTDVNGTTVNQWVNALNQWAAPSADDILRIRAIRVFVVARSPLAEKKDASGNCTATSAAQMPDTGWPQPHTAPMTWTADDRCYRYRSFQTVIPLRNVVWAKS